jgi:hypothetical protein
VQFLAAYSTRRWSSSKVEPAVRWWQEARSYTATGSGFAATGHVVASPNIGEGQAAAGRATMGGWPSCSGAGGTPPAELCGGLGQRRHQDVATSLLPSKFQ